MQTRGLIVHVPPVSVVDPFVYEERTKALPFSQHLFAISMSGDTIALGNLRVNVHSSHTKYR